MTYTLTKMSMPGWTRIFPTELDACRELLNYVCDSCLQAESQEEFGDQARPAPDPTVAKDLLRTSCGLEFELEPTDTREIKDIPCPVCGEEDYHSEINGRVVCKNCSSDLSVYMWRKARPWESK